MGRIAKVLSVTRVTREDGTEVTDIKIDPGGGVNITVEHFSAPGDDSHPLTTDFVTTNDIPRNGGEVATGYLDPLNQGLAQPGDKRIYARDADTGAPVVSWWLKNDGSGIMANSNGSIELQANGNVNINGVIIDPSGVITGVASMEVDGVEVKDHNHTQGNDSDGDAEVDVGPMQ